jgi:hypothetical protein
MERRSLTQCSADVARTDVARNRGPASHLSPGEVVARAYRAANRGRYAEANGYVAPAVRRSLLRSNKVMRTHRKKMLATLPAMHDRKQAAQIHRLLEDSRTFEDPHYCWKLCTRGGALRSVDVARETIRGDDATVTVTLRLRDGTVVTEREPLIRTRSGWRIGDRSGALQNNKMQQTRRG